MQNKVYLLFDFTHMIYKYKYALAAGKMKELTYDGKDISKMYYCLRDIEKAREKYEKLGYDVSIHVALDSKSDRKKEDTAYKANREGNRLSEDEFDEISETADLLRLAGYEVLKFDGKEADDIIATWALALKDDEFAEVVIYTNDADLLANVRDGVKVELYNSFSGNVTVNMNNFIEFTRKKFKCETFDYNHIMLYKALCGDKSDGIAGINGFGPKTYDKTLRAFAGSLKGNSKFCVVPEFVEQVINYMGTAGVLKSEQVEQALASFNLVRPRYVENLTMNKFNSTQESREVSYSRYEFVSLYDN